MIKFIALAILFSSTVHAASSIVKSESNILQIQKQKNDVVVQLPATAYDILKKWNSEFVLFNLADYSVSVLDLYKDLGQDPVPMTFIDDVDGNGRKDIVLLGSDSQKQYAIVILQLEKKWTLIKINSWSIKNIKETVIPAAEVITTSGTTTAQAKSSLPIEKGIPLYVLRALDEPAEELKKTNKIGIQIEYYLSSGDVYEVIGTKAVKFTLK